RGGKCRAGYRPGSPPPVAGLFRLGAAPLPDQEGPRGGPGADELPEPLVAGAAQAAGSGEPRAALPTNQGRGRHRPPGLPRGGAGTRGYYTRWGAGLPRRRRALPRPVTRARTASSRWKAAAITSGRKSESRAPSRASQIPANLSTVTQARSRRRRTSFMAGPLGGRRASPLLCRAHAGGEGRTGFQVTMVFMV